MIVLTFRFRYRRIGRPYDVLSRRCHPCMRVDVLCFRIRRLLCLRGSVGLLLVDGVVDLEVVVLCVELKLQKLVRAGILGLRLLALVVVSTCDLSIYI